MSDPPLKSTPRFTPVIIVTITANTNTIIGAIKCVLKLVTKLNLLFFTSLFGS